MGLPGCAWAVRHHAHVHGCAAMSYHSLTHSLTLLPVVAIPTLPTVCPITSSIIIIIIIRYLQDADEEVALEAAEFWLSFCESELGIELLQPVLGRLIPVLMKNMVRSSLL